MLSFLTLALAFGGFIASPTRVTAASQIKVVIVVGPVEGSTSRYIEHAREYAAQARAYGAAVTEVYSPRATWTRVKAAATGANIFIYLGHGNGHPSPYGAFSSLRKNGMGLNSSLNNGNSNVKYWGQYYMRTGLNLARNSVVLLNHLCYASGNSEPGRKLPTKSVAMQRADGYGTGFLRTGAKAMFATGNGSLSPVLADLFISDKTVGQIFQDDWSFTGDARLQVRVGQDLLVDRLDGPALREDGNGAVPVWTCSRATRPSLRCSKTTGPSRARPTSSSRRPRPPGRPSGWTRSRRASTTTRSAAS